MQPYNLTRAANENILEHIHQSQVFENICNE